MKNLILIAFIIFSIQATSQKPSKNKLTTKFKVSGVCGMCEERIESALDVVGVRSAEWDQETDVIEISFNPKKIKVEEMHKLLAEAGHKTDLMAANEDAYNALPNCCKYDDGIDKH